MLLYGIIYVLSMGLAWLGGLLKILKKVDVIFRFDFDFSS
jgi:hypothetical protein